MLAHQENGRGRTFEWVKLTSRIGYRNAQQKRHTDAARNHNESTQGEHYADSYFGPCGHVQVPDLVDRESENDGIGDDVRNRVSDEEDALIDALRHRLFVDIPKGVDGDAAENGSQQHGNPPQDDKKATNVGQKAK